VIAVTLAGLLVLAAGGLLGLAYRDNPKGAAGTLLASAIGGPFHLVDQNGKPFADPTSRANGTIVFFGYTHCPDACPTCAQRIVAGARQAGQARQGA